MPNYTSNVGFSDYSAEEQAILRQRKLAELLMQQGMTPLGPTENVGGWAVKRSPMEGLAKIAKAGVGAYQQSQLDERTKALAAKIRGDLQVDYDTLMTGMQGTPAQPAQPGIESVAFEGGVGPERPATPAVPAGQINPALIAQLRTPEARALAQKMWYEQNKPVSPDARLRYQGEMERHGTPSAGAILSNQGAMQRHLKPSGSAELGASTAIRGQDIGAATAGRGQDITIRGQDIGASTARRGQDIGASTAIRGQDLNVNPDIQSAVSAARAYGKEQGETRAGLAFDPVKASASARKILDAVHYDPITKTDDISKLINQSTSGILQNVTAQGFGAVTGTATSGREAIGSLMTEANRLTMDLMGGKLGSGISNADRDFVLGQLGDVANANTPANERFAAWGRALGRLRSIAGAKTQTTPRIAPASSPRVVDW